MFFKHSILIALVFTACTLVQASENKTVHILACEPEWAALAHALGDDSFDIYSATTHEQDPHHIQARPSLIARARQADILICSGAELEIGWLPVLLRKSGNPAIQPGTPGYFMATDHVRLLDVRGKVDRSEGDVHAAGNPHVHLDPHRMLQVARNFAALLVTRFPEKATLVESRLDLLEEKMQNMLSETQALSQALKGKALVVHHDSWVYLFDWLDLHKRAELEPKPGIPPSSRHMATLLGSISRNSSDLIIYSSYQNPKAAMWMSSKTGVPAIGLPYSIANWQDDDALPGFYRSLLTTLTSAIQNSTSK